MRDPWARAFHRQATADWEAHLRLSRERDLPACETLHFLQMACEKIAKAYRIRDTDAPVESLTGSHVGFPAFVRAFVLSPARKDRYGKNPRQLEALMRSLGKVAERVEALAPAVSQGAPNVEYPWECHGTVVAPADFDFDQALQRPRDPAWHQLLSIVRTAIDEF